MIKRLISVLALTVGIHLIVCPCTYARIIRTIQKRSVELPEQENGSEATSERAFEVQGIARPSQVNTFQFLLPFWWHYLRPMLNIFATNTNFRQSLQKEYEFEIEHGSLTEIEAQETEHSENFEQPEGNEFEFAGHEVELNNREQTNENELLNDENGRLDVEHMIESNILTPFGTEQESLGQEQTEVPELDSMIENAQFDEEMGNSEEKENIGDFGTNVNNFLAESETGDENKIESGEENIRRFFLPGNIIGSFSNSLTDFMPTIWEQEKSEHDKHDGVFANEETDSNHPPVWEQSSEGTLEMNGDKSNSEGTSFLLQSPFNANSRLSNNFGNQLIQGEDVGDRSPRSFEIQNIETKENEITVSEPNETEQSFGLFSGSAKSIPSDDSDNADSGSDFIPNQMFRPPLSLFSQGLHSQNDQDSGI